MQNIFLEVNSLDRRCYEEFELSEDILMENAAKSIAEHIKKKFDKGSRVLIVAGSGNNGADGITLARILHGDFSVGLYIPNALKSPISSLQIKRANSVGIEIITKIEVCDVLVDALFGSGLSRKIDKSTAEIINKMNSIDSYKIACDVPSGIRADGLVSEHTFKADITLTMGGLKLSLYGDMAKDYVGEIEVCDLGISREIYEIKSTISLLDKSDLTLPHRVKKSTHKGEFGHLSVICGEKIGASVIAGSAALRFGVGLVTLISNENVHIPYELMQSHSVAKNSSAIAIGMGLGVEFSTNELKDILDNDLPLVLDADIFSHELIIELIKRDNIVITPHPKEFVTLLSRLDLADISVNELQSNRFKYVQLFSNSYPHVVLLLKGANVIISQHEAIFVNPHGTSALAKGGSGDVLSGIIGALLAQGNSALKSAIDGSLAHTLSGSKFTKNNYALTPFDLIDQLSTL